MRIALFVLLVASCGRVSFIGDGQVGDGGAFGGSSGAPRSSSAAPASSDDGTMTACGSGRGPRPVFEVREDDVTDGFSSAWATRGCTGCHVPAVEDLGIPADPSSDRARTATALSEYCRTVGGFPVEDLTASTVQHTTIVCQLVPTGLTGDAFECSHAGQPRNDDTVEHAAIFGESCLPAAARYRDALLAWLDAGVGCEEDAGALDEPDAGPPDCMRADLEDQFQPLYERASASCALCHANGFSAEAACFDLTTREIARASFCDRARTGVGPLRRATYEETILYRATRDDVNERFRCTTRLNEFHEESMREGVDEAARAWYDAIFVTP